MQLKYWVFAFVVFLFLLGTSGVDGLTFFNTPVVRNIKAARMMQRKIDLQCTKSCKEKNDEGLELSACVQKCSSMFCYEAVITQELEEGEIDTRTNRFKTCLLEDIKRRKKPSTAKNDDSEE